jgi:VanZ family protein
MTITKPLRIAVALSYLLLISLLFFLPGSAFPRRSWLNAILFDKCVHIGLFAIFAWLWCWALRIYGIKSLAVVLIVLLGYGVGVEIVQDAWIANRSFDTMDILADGIGGVIGLLFWNRQGYKKK